jgi:hypothetical protein
MEAVKNSPSRAGIPLAIHQLRILERKYGDKGMPEREVRNWFLNTSGILGTGVSSRRMLDDMIGYNVLREEEGKVYFMMPSFDSE